MSKLPPREEMAPAAKLNLRLSAALFAVFWAGIVSGKLHISFGLKQFPLIPEIALALILAVTLALALVACLLEEQRRANSVPAADTTDSAAGAGFKAHFYQAQQARDQLLLEAYIVYSLKRYRARTAAEHALL